MRVEQISVFLRNELGVLSELLKKLGEQQINILGMTINEAASFGELRLVTDKVAEAKNVLNELVVSFNVVKVLVVALDDRPGELMKIAVLLSENEINIDYIYTLSAGKAHSYVAIKTWNMDITERLLNEHNMRLVSIDDIVHNQGKQ